MQRLAEERVAGWRAQRIRLKHMDSNPSPPFMKSEIMEPYHKRNRRTKKIEL